MHAKTVTQTREHDNQVAHIRLNCPPANILDTATIEAILAALPDLQQDPSLKALVFEGVGDHFSFGASVEEHQLPHVNAMLPLFHKLFRALAAFDVPTVSVVRGQCLGGAMELATACNFVIAHPSARFGQPEVRLGVFPPVAAVLLPSIIGQARADDLLLTGRSIDADTAHAWGLLHAVSEDPEGALQTLLSRHLLPKSASSLRFTVRASRTAWRLHFNTLLDATERLYLDHLMRTHDASEGIQAFIQKRPPTWINA